MANFKTIVSGEIPVLIDFHAEWCGPCKMMSPILKEVKEKLGSQVKIVKVDVDKNQQLANAYNVKGVPTLMLFNKGRQVWRESGVRQADELISIIQSQLN